jgi:hypothetical protein
MHDAVSIHHRDRPATTGGYHMPISNIKRTRALAKSTVGRFPGSADAMMECIPESVKIALHSGELAKMLDAMWAACQEAKGIAVHDALAEGAVWDARSRCMRSIAA